MNKANKRNTTDLSGSNINLHNPKSIAFNIIAIGASAGGLEALQEFLSNLPALENACIIVAQHLSPTHKSMLVQLLSRETNLEVEEALHNTLLAANKVYITPPDKDISISLGRIILSKPLVNVGPKPSVDILFQSLQENSAEHIVGIILSGTGSDGASGVKAIKKSGGLVLVQEPQTAKYNGMPLAAIETGDVDVVLPPDKMGEEIKEFFTNPGYNKTKTVIAEEADSGVEKIIKLLSRRTGTDFSNYKSATINRRLEKRLTILKIKSIEDYLVLLEKNPRELDEMFNMVLIGVTTFFRDMEAFGVLENYLHKIINTKTNKDAIRIWVPGCSTGEEAYSIAILLHRILKDRIQNYNIQIFATDIDDRAIAHARKGLYSITALQDIPAEIVEQYFLKKENDFELVKAIRSMVLFTKHDLTNNPPFLKLDLISCRNLLIYFGASLQQQIIPIFHYALLQDAYLLLGKSETIGQFTDLFTTVDIKNKFYQRKRGGNIHNVKFSTFKAQKQPLPSVTTRKTKTDVSISDLVKETLFNTYENPYVVINEQHDILETNGDLRLFLSLPQGSINVNLIKMVNPELQIEIRSVVTRAIKDREQVKSGIKKFMLFNSTFYVRVTAKPLIYTDAANELYLVVFERLDLEEFVSKGIVSPDAQLTDVRVQELEHELAATKEHLQTYIEELETSNEEMQSLNEEMQSTNEELQSSNEELETSNEELQSTNEEIQITYAELKAANDELERKEKLLLDNEANIEALLNNTLQAFILLDSAYKIVAFNEKALGLFLSLRDKTLNANGSFVDFVEPEQLEKLIRDFGKVAKGQTINHELKLVDYTQKERWFSVSYTPVFGIGTVVSGISIGMLDITELKIALTDLNDKEKLISSVFDATSIGICITDDKGKFIDVNESYCQIYGYAKDELIGNSFTAVVAPALREHTQQLHDAFLETGVEMPAEWEVIKKDGKPVKIFVTAALLIRPNGKRCKVTSVRDITLQKVAEKIAHDSGEKYKAIINSSINAIIQITNDGKIVEANKAAQDLFGYSEQEFETILERDIIDQEGPGVFELLRIRKEAGQVRGELSGLKKNGEKFPVIFASSHFADSYGNEYFFTMIYDVTARKKAEDEISIMISNTEEAFILLDLQLSIVSFNKQAEELYRNYFGIDFKAGQSIFNYARPDRISQIKELYSEVLNNGKSESSELVVSLGDGSSRYISLKYKPAKDKAGYLMGVFISAIDITEERRSFLELQKTKSELEKIMNSSLDMIISVDHNGFILTVNIACKRILGYEPYELIGQPLFNYTYTEDLQASEAAAKNVMQGNIATNFENRYVRKDGSIVPLIWSTNWDPNEQIRYGVARDATAQKQQELQLKLSEQRFKSLVQDGSDLIGIIDQQANYIYVSPTVEQILGYTTQEFMERNAFDFIHPDDRDSVQAEFAKINEVKKIQLQSFRFINKKGEYRWIETTITNLIGEPGIDGIVANSRDITERISAQTALKKSEEKYRELFENNPAPMFTWDFETLQIIDCNSETLIKYGYKREEFLKLNVRDIRPADNIPFIEELTQSEKFYIDNHKKLSLHKNKNGELMYMDMTCHLFDYNGRKVALSMAIDVTAKLKAEEELRLSETMLAEAQRLAKMGSWNFDFKTDHLTWSDELYKVFGTDKATFLETHQSFIEFIDPEYRELVVATSKKTQQTGEPFNIIYSITTAKGEKRVIEEYGYGEKDNSGDITRMFGTAQDVTERKEAEALIIEANERYEYATRATSDIIWDWDFASNKVYYASSIEKLLGYPAAERKQDLPFYYDNIHPEDRDKIVFNVDDFKYGLKSFWEDEYRLKKADGNYAVIHDTGIVIKNDDGIGVRMVGSMRDITKQKGEQQYLKLLSSVITNANDAVLITEAEPINEPGPKIVYVNEAFTKMTGFSVEDVTGKTPRIFQGPNTDRSELDKLGDALKNRRQFETSLINYKKDGGEFWTNFSVSPVANEEGVFTHFISIQRDVTHIKLLELQKALLNELTLLFSNPFDLPKILTDIIKKVAEFAEFELAEAWLLSTESDHLKRVANYNKTSKEKCFFEAKEDNTVLGPGEGFAGKVWLQKSTQYWSNVPENKDYFKRKAAGKAGLQSACGIPLIYNGQIIGVFSFFTSASIINFQKVEMLFKEISSQIALEIKRKQAERELEQLFTYAPDIVAIAGFDGYFKKANPAFCAMLGLTEEEILARPFMEMIHPDDKSGTQKYVVGLTSSGSVLSVENRYRTREGKYINISWTATSAIEEELIFAVGKNVTEKKELEELLANTSAMARIGSWELNLMTNELFWSAVTKEIHGLDGFFVPTLESAMSFYKKGESDVTIRQVIEQCINDGISFNVEVQIITADGITEKWVKVIGEAEFANGQCIRIYGSFQDIDDLKRNQIALAAILSEKNEILESIGDGFFAIDKNYVVTYWNKKAEAIMKRSREEIIGKDLREIYPNHPGRTSYAHYESAFKKQTVHVFETYTAEVDRWFEAAVYPSGNSLSVYFKDITERKLTEQEMNLLNESLKIQKTDLERSNKELEQFAFVASHDLQEPLRMVTSFLSQLEKKYDGLLDEKGKKYIHFAVDGALRMRGIILDLLEYSRAGRFEEALEITDPNEIIEEIKMLLKKQITEKKAIITIEKLPLLKMNKTPMRQVLQNLIENSLKYVKEGIKPEIDISAVDDAAFWKIIVKDNGIGMKAEYFEKIFIIFQRLHLKDKYSGTGLGLAVTKKIIENHGGTIWVSSEEGVGSTFYFTIPK